MTLTTKEHCAFTQDLTIECIALSAYNAEFYSHILNDKFKYFQTVEPTGLNVDFHFSGHRVLREQRNLI